MEEKDVRYNQGINFEYQGYTDQFSGHEKGIHNLVGPQRSIRDYFLMFRERIWYLVVAIFIVLLGAVLYTVTKTKMYTASARIQILKDDPVLLPSRTELELNEIRTAEDLNTQVSVFNSVTILRRVEERLKADEFEEFMAPYKSQTIAGVAVSAVEVLGKGRRIIPQRATLILLISFSHPDPVVAARIANLFAEEFSDYNQMLNVDSSVRAVQALKERVEQQKDRVEELELQIAEYREQNDAISLDESENTLRSDLLQLSQFKLTEKNTYDRLAIQLEQIEAYRKEGKNLWELPFLAEEPRVSSLLSQISQTKIQIASLSKRYREKHPVMITQFETLEESQSELKLALDDAASKLQAALDEAKDNFDLTTQKLEETENELFELSKTRIAYNALVRVMDVEQNFLQALTSRMTEESAQVNFKKTNVRMIDEAFPPVKHSSPDIFLNIVAGLFGGISVGVGLIFAVAFFDDRVKGTFDIEETLGLPLIGVTPRVKNPDSAEKAKMVSTNMDYSITEAFRSIYSTLKLNEISKNSKIIIVTSTIPGEGKSFVSSNLALTFANHGEKTLLMDGDLRLPSVARLLQVDQELGVITHINDGSSLDDVIKRELYPSFDVLASGSKTKNPTQILNSSKFRAMLSELRNRYDRIIIDSPPLEAVSDALNLLPAADGVLYVVRFNKVGHRMIKKNIRNIRSSNKPLLGSILNGIDKNVSYRYTDYDYPSDSYSDYYDVQKEDEENSEDDENDETIEAYANSSEIYESVETYESSDEIYVSSGEVYENSEDYENYEDYQDENI